MAGQNDFVYFLSPQQKTVIDRAKNLTAVTGPTLYCIQIFLNYGRPPLDNPKIRLAINHAIDRVAFSKATMGGLAEPAWMALPSAHWAYDAKLANGWPHDPDKAQKLVAEAGHPDGIDITLLGYSDQRSQQRQEVLMEQLAKAGIRVKWQTGSIPEMSAAFFADKKGEGLLAAWTGRPDPSPHLLADVRQGLLLQRRPHRMVARAHRRPARDPRQRGPRSAQGRLRQGAEDRRRAAPWSCRWSSSSSSTPRSPRSRDTGPTCWASRASTASGWNS